MPIKTYQSDYADAALPDGGDARGHHQADAGKDRWSKASSETGGRNSTGRVTSRFIGGGAQAGLPRSSISSATSTAFRPRSPRSNTIRTARRASRCCNYADGEKRYIIAPVGLKVGRTVMSGPKADILVGNALPLKNIPPGTVVHNIELKPGKGAQMARSAGAQAQLVSREAELALLEAAFGRNPPRAGRVHGDGRARWATSITRTSRSARPGRKRWLGKHAAQPRRIDEPGGSPARRRRGQDLGRPPSGDAVGPADARLQDAQQQAHRQVDREPQERRRGKRIWVVHLIKDRSSTTT